MNKVMLVCNGGMSTSIMARQIRDASEGTFDVVAFSESTYLENLTDEIHVILIAPQIRFLANEIQKAVGENRTVRAIDLRVYGLMDGKKVLQMIRDIYAEKNYPIELCESEER